MRISTRQTGPPKKSPRRAALALATCAGLGHIPGAPGTVGSLLALGLAYALVHRLQISPAWLALLAALLFGPAVRAAEAAESHFGRRDPPEVIVDEVIGQWLALAAAAPLEWAHWLAAFFLFRFFDVVKPFPIRRMERWKGGYGVVADDAAAGLCAMMILSGLRWLSPW